MERLYSQTLGVPVVAEDVRSPIGIVRDFVISSESGKILALVLNKRQNIVLVERDIQGFEFFPRVSGADVLISGEDVIRVNDEQKKQIFYINNKVFTNKGKYIGIVEDFAYDDKMFKLTKLFVSKNWLYFINVDKRIIPMEEVVKVKKDKIIINDDFVTEKQPSMANAS
jgi:uncharacterized protein YrrD